MATVIPAAKKVLIGVLAVGALSLGAAGAAGAAASTPAARPKLTHFNCTNATKALTRIEKGEARIAAGLPKMTAAKDKATKAGHLRRAEHLEKRITRLESSKVHAHLIKRSAAIEAKCHVPAPNVNTTSGTTKTT